MGPLSRGKEFSFVQSAASDSVINIGVIGLGRGFMLTAPTLHADKRVDIRAAVALRQEERDRFEVGFGRPAYADSATLCDRDDIDLVYIAVPHELHAEQAIACMAAGKHVLVEKPMATNLSDCQRMIDAARQNNVHIFVGPSHSYDPQIVAARQLIETNKYGALKSITAIQYTDFVYRPRRPEELRREDGGGGVFSQALHHFDVLQMLTNSTVHRISGIVGDWDAKRSTDGAYNAFFETRNGVACSISYSGYGHFDSDSLLGWRGELGGCKPPGAFQELVRRPAGDESHLKRGRGIVEADLPKVLTEKRSAEHFGYILISCEHADIIPTPLGIKVYADDHVETVSPPTQPGPRSAVFDEIWGVLFDNRQPLHDGAWGKASLEACFALIEASDTRREVVLKSPAGALHR